MTITNRTAKRNATALLRDTRGATLMEYLMLAGLIALAAFTGFKTFGTNVGTTITTQAGVVTTIPSAPQ